MPNVDINLTPKQSKAFRYLRDNETTLCLFGGGAGSAKSFLGCLWITNNALMYPGTRWLIGRTRLSALKVSTLKSLFDLFRLIKLESDIHYNYNQQDNIIKFKNGSEIILRDLQYYPSDPDVDALGGIELTGAFADEAQQMNEKVFNVLRSRIRYKLDEYQLTGKILLTCNPHQGYLKRLFWQPTQDGTLPNHMKFVEATAFDNPHLPEQYIESLRRLPEKQKQRLLMGSWEYSEDIDMLFQYDNIMSSFHRHQSNPNDKYYMSLDIAGPGKDKTVMVISKGIVIVEINEYKNKDINQLAEIVRERMIWYKLPPSQVIGDADGLGRGLTELLKIKQFINNSTPLNKENFSNLKSQCYFKLADMFRDGKISINLNKPELMDIITEELLTIRIKDVEKDGKQSVIPKEEIKAVLGNSPDYADALMMLMYFNLKVKATGKYAITTI